MQKQKQKKTKKKLIEQKHVLVNILNVQVMHKEKDFCLFRYQLIFHFESFSIWSYYPETNKVYP